jgi:hypothetical protein
MASLRPRGSPAIELARAHRRRDLDPEIEEFGEVRRRDELSAYASPPRRALRPATWALSSTRRHDRAA